MHQERAARRPASPRTSGRWPGPTMMSGRWPAPTITSSRAPQEDDWCAASPPNIGVRWATNENDEHPLAFRQWHRTFVSFYIVTSAAALYSPPLSSPSAPAAITAATPSSPSLHHMPRFETEPQPEACIRLSRGQPHQKHQHKKHHEREEDKRC